MKAIAIPQNPSPKLPKFSKLESGVMIQSKILASASSIIKAHFVVQFQLTHIDAKFINYPLQLTHPSTSAERDRT